MRGAFVRSQTEQPTCELTTTAFPAGTLGTVDEATIERIVHRLGPLEHFTEPEVREIALVALAVMLAEDPARQRRDEAARESRERLDQLGRD